MTLAVNARVKSRKLLLDLGLWRVYCISMRPPERFTWGRIVAEYEIGPYHIVAYHPTLPSNRGKGVDETVTHHHLWIDGKDTHTGAVTLEGAMILAVATRTLGRHPEGLSMIARALKLPEEM